MMIAADQKNNSIISLTLTLRVNARLVFCTLRISRAARNTESLFAYVAVTAVRLAVTQRSAGAFYTHFVQKAVLVGGRARGSTDSAYTLISISALGAGFADLYRVSAASDWVTSETCRTAAYSLVVGNAAESIGTTGS